MLKEISDLRDKVDSLKSKVGRSQGVLEQLTKELKEEFSCSTLKEAKSLLAREEKALKSLEERCQTLLESFEEKWKEIINEG